MNMGYSKGNRGTLLELPTEMKIIKKMVVKVVVKVKPLKPGDITVLQLF